MRKIIFLALVVSGLAGCASSPKPVVLEWHGSDEGLLMAQQAADEWMSTCDAAIVVARDNGGVRLEETSTEPALGRLGQTYEDHDGHVDGVFIWRASGERTTMAHEFGHALGIVPHAPAGLMAQQAVRGPGVFHVTSAECEQL